MDWELLPLPDYKPLTLRERDEILAAAERRNMVQRDVEYLERMLDQWHACRTILPVEMHFPNEFGVDVAETIEFSANICKILTDGLCGDTCVKLQIIDHIGVDEIRWFGGCRLDPERMREHRLKLSLISQPVLYIHELDDAEDDAGCGIQPFSLPIRLRCAKHLSGYCYVRMRLSVNIPRIFYSPMLQLILRDAPFLLKELRSIILDYLCPESVPHPPHWKGRDLSWTI